MPIGPHSYLLSCVAVVAGIMSTTAAGEEAKTSLFAAGSKADLFKYLATHRIPQAPYINASEASPPDLGMIAREKKEVARAADLFVKGDAELRLKIAESMDRFYDEAPKMWDACTKDDFEARHHLLWGLANANTGKRAKEARTWMLEKADHSLPGPLLRAICNSPYLLRDISPDEEKKFPTLLEALYRQGGEMTCVSPISTSRLYVGDKGPVEKYVVRALRELKSPEAQELLFQWLKRDGKKSAPSVRQEMWSTLGHVNFRRLAIQRSTLERMAQQREVVEAWLLAGPPKVTDPRISDRSGFGKSLVAGVYHKDEKTAKAFQSTVVRQLANPDRDVVSATALYIVTHEDSALVASLVEQLELTAIARERAARALKAEFAKHKPSGSEHAVKAFEERAKQIMKALGGKRAEW